MAAATQSTTEMPRLSTSVSLGAEPSARSTITRTCGTRRPWTFSKCEIYDHDIELSESEPQLRRSKKCGPLSWLRRHVRGTVSHRGSSAGKARFASLD